MRPRFRQWPGFARVSETYAFNFAKTRRVGLLRLGLGGSYADELEEEEAEENELGLGQTDADRGLPKTRVRTSNSRRRRIYETCVWGGGGGETTNLQSFFTLFINQYWTRIIFNLILSPNNLFLL